MLRSRRTRHDKMLVGLQMSLGEGFEVVVTVGLPSACHR